MASPLIFSFDSEEPFLSNVAELDNCQTRQNSVACSTETTQCETVVPPWEKWRKYGLI